MEKKATQSRTYNKEKSKQKFLNAVGEILVQKGFSALKVNDIAAQAGLDKKLIYKYFGGTEELIEAYLTSRDFWSNVSAERLPVDVKDGGLEVLKKIFTSQFDTLQENKELQKILLWGITEKRASLQKIAELREESGERLLTEIVDPYFGSDARDFRAAAALLVSGIYYLNLYAGLNANTFAGIDLTSEEGKADIKKAVGRMLDLLYRESKLAP